jgi:hypothetical protein
MPLQLSSWEDLSCPHRFRLANYCACWNWKNWVVGNQTANQLIVLLVHLTGLGAKPLRRPLHQSFGWYVEGYEVGVLHVMTNSFLQVEIATFIQTGNDLLLRFSTVLMIKMIDQKSAHPGYEKPRQRGNL